MYDISYCGMALKFQTPYFYFESKQENENQNHTKGLECFNDYPILVKDWNVSIRLMIVHACHQLNPL
jgi:hypothetical protein